MKKKHESEHAKHVDWKMPVNLPGVDPEQYIATATSAGTSPTPGARQPTEAKKAPTSTMRLARQKGISG